MNIEKFTNKSKEALLASQTIAQEYQNAELLNLHLLYALLKQADGLAPSIIEKLGLSCQLFEKKVVDELAKLPKVSGAVELYQSKEFSALLKTAMKEAGELYEGGSMYALIINSEGATITEERVYELYTLLKAQY